MAISTRSIVGQWYLILGGSDTFPGLDTLHGCPWAAVATEYLTIEQRKSGQREEVVISCRHKQR